MKATYMGDKSSVTNRGVTFEPGKAQPIREDHAEKLRANSFFVVENEIADGDLPNDEADTTLEELKAEADRLGVEYGPRIGEDTLGERVAEAKAKLANGDPAVTNGDVDAE